MSKVLILGSKGRLGAALARQWTPRHDVTALGRPEVDAADLDGLEKVLVAQDYDVVVNAIALTNVDRCETARDEASTVNALAVGRIARDAAAKGARLIHISTDYVFDGEKTSPYVETDEPRPLGYYGRTKLDGEAEALAASDRHLVARVSWVFGPDKPSFVDMIVDRAIAQDTVEAIADKTSSPTFAEDAAEWLEPFLSPGPAGGIYHLCNGGVCTWQEYGQHALDCARAAGAPLRARTVAPLSLASMKTFVAPRPPRTEMDTTKLAETTGITPRPWQQALQEYITRKFS